jgi:hypothetical protein
MFFLPNISRLYAQEVFSVTGRVTDSISNRGLDAAGVTVMKEKDSVYVTSVVSDPDGTFRIAKIAPGNYRVVFSFMGYGTEMQHLRLSGAARTVNLGVIGLMKQDMLLDEVRITAKFNPIIVKKDTIEFNTSAYKTQESDVVEDLLKKLPGVDVDESGTVTSGGQQITKVYVDGKQFFGDDPKVATKNLPANIIDKVQVVDRRSDQAQFTGIEDDNTEKVINLTLRPGNRDGMFGRFMAGYGTDDRYDANGILSYFNGDTQLAGLLSTNNTNNIGFTDFMGDVMSSMGGGRRMGGGTRGSGMGSGMGGGMGGGGNRGGGNYNLGGISLSAGNSGVSTTTSGGGNLNYRFGEKLKLGANYYFNAMKRFTDQESHQTNYMNRQSEFYYDQHQQQNSKSQNHRINLELDYTINENNSLLFRPNLNFGSGQSDSRYRYGSYTAADSLNSGEALSDMQNRSLSTSGMLLWRHKFAKEGRTLSVNLTYGYTQNNADGKNEQMNRTFEQPLLSSDSIVDQTYVNENQSYNYGVRTSYTEPVGKDRYLEFSYSYNQNRTDAEKITVNVADHSTDEDYSSKYENVYTSHQGDIRFNTRRENYNYTLGIGVQQYEMESVQWDTLSFSKPFWKFSPSANITFGTTRQKMLRLDYRGTAQQPSIQQLQPVKDNSNPLLEQTGNLQLKPSFLHSVRATYNHFNPETLRTFLTSLSFNTTTNSIVNSIAYDSNGKQTITPVNADGAYNANASMMVNIPIANTKLSLNNTLSGNYGRSISYSNTINSADMVETVTRNASVSETFRLTFRNDLLEMTGSYRLGYNHARYSTENKATTNYYNHRVGGDLFLNFPLGFILASNISYHFYRGYNDGNNRDMTLWTADLSKKVFKNQRGTVKLSVYDILKQNSSYTRTTTDNYVADVRSNIIGQFFMLSFLYRFNSFGGSNNSSDGQRESMPREMMREGPGPRTMIIR